MASDPKTKAVDPSFLKSEGKKGGTVIPVTEFFVSDSLKNEIRSAVQNSPFITQIDSIISTLESTGELPDTVLQNQRLVDLVGGIDASVLPFQEGIKQEIDELEPQKENLNASGLRRLSSLFQAASVGAPGFEEDTATRKAAFKDEVLDVLITIVGGTKDEPDKQRIAEEAAENFVVQRRTGERGLGDFISDRISETNVPRGEVNTAFKGLSQRLTQEFLVPAGDVPGSFQAQFEELAPLLEAAEAEEAEASRVQGQIDLASGQRQASADLFSQAIAQFGKESPQFTPEFSEEALANIQQSVLKQGVSALSTTEAGAARRGITGSSIEAFQLAETQGQIAQALRDATFQFLIKSGDAGQRNREFLASSLFNQSQTLLGAGQGTEGLVTGREISGSQLALNQQQLAAQIQQFNQALNQSQSQFQQTLKSQQDQAAQDLQLLSQALGSGGGGASDILGLAFGGASALGTVGLGAAAVKQTFA